MATTKDLIQSGRTAMEKGVESAKREFATVRAGKASPNMLDAVRVYPASGGTAMLPLTPDNNYTATILFCGGSNIQPDQ